MTLLETIEKAWGWTGVTAVVVVEASPFGNLILLDTQGRFWRLCPEELYCEIIAWSEVEYAKLYADSGFQLDWQATAMRATAEGCAGLLRPGYHFCLKVPGPLGGTYEEKNIGVLPIAELISMSGELAFRIKDLPDGTPFQIVVE